MQKYVYEYFSGEDVESFRFLRVPKIFMEDPDYEDLGLEECVLYSVLLEMMSNAKKYEWIDDAGHVYVICGINKIRQILRGCCDEKAKKTLVNLEEHGLIEKRRRGQGKTDIIYVKNFVKRKKTGSENEASSEIKKPEPEKIGIKNLEKTGSRTRKNRDLEPEKTGAKETKSNDTNIIYNPSIYQNNIKGQVQEDRSMDSSYDPSVNKAYETLIRENIGYESVVTNLDATDKAMLDEFVMLIIDIVTNKSKFYQINGGKVSGEVVRAKLLKISSDDLLDVLDQYKRVTGKVRNPRNYMITMLYNAGTTRYVGQYNESHRNEDMNLSADEIASKRDLEERELERMLGII